MIRQFLSTKKLYINIGDINKGENMGAISALLKYGIRAAKILPEFIIGTGSETVGAAMRATKGSIWTKVKAGGLALEKKNSACKDGYFKRVGKEIWNTPKDLKTDIKSEISAVKTHNVKVMREAINNARKAMPSASREEILKAAKASYKKTKYTKTELFKALRDTRKAMPTATKRQVIKAAKASLKKGTKSTGKAFFKGLFKTLGKKLPAIGAIVTLAIEAPNICKAFKHDGFMAGMKEIGGAGLELGCMAAGAAIGSAICPGIGTIIGSIIGGIGGSLLRGQTTSEKRDIIKEAGLSDEQIDQLKEEGYSYDDMIKMVEEEQAKEAEQVEQLKNLGFSEEEIQQLFDNGMTYEQIIEEYNKANSEQSTASENSSSVQDETQGKVSDNTNSQKDLKSADEMAAAYEKLESEQDNNAGQVESDAVIQNTDAEPTSENLVSDEDLTKKVEEEQEKKDTFQPLQYQSFFQFTNPYTFSGYQSNPFLTGTFNSYNTGFNPYSMSYNPYSMGYNPLYNASGSLFGNGMYNNPFGNYSNDIYGQLLFNKLYA
jgi:hypothetical protein